MDVSDNRLRIGQQLAALRTSQGLTQRQLAELAGVNHSNIGKLEAGAYNASIDILSKVCKPLGAELNITIKATE